MGNNERDYSMVAIAIACALAALFTILFLSTMPFNRAVVARRDFITYWATGRQLARHGDPYDPAALSKIERDAGFEGGSAYFMRNVPWALPLALPLGYFNPQVAALPWSLLMMGLLTASVRMVWTMTGRVGSHLDWLGYCFPPALFCVILGQTSILLLFGLVLFLRLQRTHPFAAGGALWLCSLKPHLFLPFGVVLLAWMVVTRSYRILAGALTALAAGAVITAWIAPHAFGQYAYYVHTSVMTHEFTACFGDLLRDSVNPAAEWLAFVPAALGCAWALGYFWTRRHAWDWLENGSLLVLVSLLVAPFGWIFDQSLAIPAILVGAARTRSRVVLTAMAGMYLLIEFQVNRFDLNSRAYLWCAPAWVVWYVLARRAAREPGASPQTVAAPSLD
jgi:Glycosyltransferase family 87